MKSAQRSFVFLNLGGATSPAALIIHDRVTAADASFRKTWLLHTVEEPQIQRDAVTAGRVGKGYAGRLVNTALLPEWSNLDIVKIGGPAPSSSSAA